MIHSSKRSLCLHSLALATALAFAAPSAFAIDAHASASAAVAAQDAAQYDRFIIKYREGTAQAADKSTIQRVLNEATGRAAPQLKNAKAASAIPLSVRYGHRLGVGADVIHTSQRLTKADADTLMHELAANPDVEYVEIDKLNKPLLTPNDTNYSSQWHYFEAAAGINAPAAWDKATGTGVVVAVIDTGITPHTDLTANIVAGYDFISDLTVAQDGNGRDSNPNDPGDFTPAGACGPGSPFSNSSWHGTHVAGTVAALTNNAKGVAGVAFNAKVMPLRVLGRCGGFDSDISDAIKWAAGGSVPGVPNNANPVEVINMSLGGSGACSATEQSAINTAVAAGVIVVVAAGNDNTNVSNASPANCSNVVAVASVGRTGARSSFSNFGSLIDVSAPGGDGSNSILSTINLGATTQGAEGYTGYQGTSMATPHVAGTVALMQSAKVNTPATVESLLKSTARPLPITCTPGCGAGIIDASAAITAAINGLPPPPPPGALTNGVPVTGLTATTGNSLNYTMAVPAGASNLKFVTSGGTGDADLYVKFGSAPTDTVFDCRPFLTGNNETCNITTAQVGTYFVRLKAFSTFSGVSLTGSYSLGGATTYTNSTVMNIPDGGTINSPVTVSGRSGNASSTSKVSVNITHTYRGDIKIDLIAPDGSVYALKASNGSDSVDNVIATYTTNLSSEVMNGTWNLRVQDVFAGDTGKLNTWSLIF